MPKVNFANFWLPKLEYYKKNSHCIQDCRDPDQIRQDCITELLVIIVALFRQIFVCKLDFSDTCNYMRCLPDHNCNVTHHAPIVQKLFVASPLPSMSLSWQRTLYEDFSIMKCLLQFCAVPLAASICHQKISYFILICKFWLIFFKTF